MIGPARRLAVLCFGSMLVARGEQPTRPDQDHAVGT
jgi:hypothetical protein